MLPAPSGARCSLWRRLRPQKDDLSRIRPRRLYGRSERTQSAVPPGFPCRRVHTRRTSANCIWRRPRSPCEQRVRLSRGSSSPASGTPRPRAPDSSPPSPARQRLAPPASLWRYASSNAAAAPPKRCDRTAARSRGSRTCVMRRRMLLGFTTSVGRLSNGSKKERAPLSGRGSRVTRSTRTRSAYNFMHWLTISGTSFARWRLQNQLPSGR